MTDEALPPHDGWTPPPKPQGWAQSQQPSGQPPAQPMWSPPQPAMQDLHSLRARLKKAFAPLIAAGAFLAKFGVVLLKLKSVVFLGSFTISVLAYAQLWGWKYALGFVLLILVHELGHVIALRARGIKASALVFLPLLGAFTAWHPEPRSAYEDAETALAGPVAGVIASLALGYYAHAHDSGLYMSLAFSGLLINLFNLIPVKPLDGSKITDLLAPWVWGALAVGLLFYELVSPGGVAILALLAVSFQFYRVVRDHYGLFKRAAQTIEPHLRTRLSVAYLGVAVVTALGMDWTYVHRTLS